MSDVTPKCSMTGGSIPMDVDHFSDVDWRRRVTPAEMKLMNNMREDDVKHAIAEIIGAPFVPKDWAGSVLTSSPTTC